MKMMDLAKEKPTPTTKLIKPLDNFGVFSGGRSIATVTAIIVSSLLTATLIIVIAAIYSLENDKLNDLVREKAETVLYSLRASHTQAMLFRGDKLDDNPVIEALNGTFKQLSDNQKNMKLWLIMGPKVIRYQQQNDRIEIEPPIDNVDREALRLRKTVARFESTNIYRLTTPVVLGEGVAKDLACTECHGKLMGISQGEPIGGFSLRFDISDERQRVFYLVLQTTVIMIVLFLVVALFIILALNKWVSNPIKSVAAILHHVNEKDDSKEIPEPNSTAIIELRNMLEAANVFSRFSQSRMEQLRKALDEQAIVAITDIKGTITYVNDKFCEISEYSREELVGSNHRIIKSSYHSKNFFREMYLSISQGKVWHGQVCNRSKSGKIYWVDTSIAPYMDSDNKPVSYIAIRTDITQLIDARNAMAKAKLEAEDSAKAKSEFLASMSHEIRTPMNGVLGMLGLLQKTKLNEDQSNKLTLAKSSAQSLLSLINDILDFSKIEAGKLELELIDFNLERLFSEFMQAQAFNASRKGLELILNTSKLKSTHVRGDPGRLRQILSNLVGNAFKFTSQGEIVVSAEVITNNTENVRLICSVTDSGIGIPKDKQTQLFEAFTQADSSTTRKFGGTGLGLTITKRLCELMGGEIGFTSELNKGSCFTFTINFKVSEKTLPILPKTDISHLHILVVDDNSTNRQVLFEQLTFWGASVVLAESGRDALSILEARNKNSQLKFFDLAILDMQMPKMDGAELGKIIRQQTGYNSMKLVMMTSMDQGGDHQYFADLGFQAYFAKPVTNNDLFNALKVVSVGGDVMKRAYPLVTSEYLNSIVPQDKTFELKLSSRESINLQGAKVLLVEDDPINQEVAKGIMEQLRLNIDVAENGVEAIKILAQETSSSPFLIILMDCQMPKMDGYETTRLIRKGAGGEIYKDVPIIAMTANAMKGDKQKCINAGMDDYISKPVDPDILQTKIANWIVKQGFVSNLPHSTGVGNEIPKASGLINKQTETSSQENDYISFGSSVWAYDKALNRMKNNNKIFIKIIKLVLDDTPSRIDELKLAIQQQAKQEIHQLAHRIKGSCANIGGEVFANLMARVEKDTNFQLDVQSTINEIESEWKKLQEQLVDFLDETKK